MGFQNSIRVSRERIGVIIGKKGKVKNEIEKKCKVNLEIDSDYGDIVISPIENYDFVNIAKANEIIIAISKGFPPEKAFTLLEEDMIFQLLDLRDYSGKSTNSLGRIKSRIIGENGKARKTIEELTGTQISIYGHTVGIIGKSEEVKSTIDALNMLCKGNSHKFVYNFLQELRRKAKIERLNLWEGNSFVK